MSEIHVPRSHHVAELLGPATRVGSERRWSVRLHDGRLGMLAQLLPELCRDEAVRQRYVGDLARASAAQVDGVAPLLDRSVDDEAHPWRLRVDPKGQSLAVWLRARAPVPFDEAAQLGAALAETLHALHQRGVVVRDLHPRGIAMTEQGPVLTDIGLSRVDLLSTRTAASLVLEGSPYASPEQLRKTFVDQRSDLYGLGVILWEALTATRPYGDDIALLADPDVRPALASLRDGMPAGLAQVVERCIDHDLERRPETAALVVDILRGRADVSDASTRASCQNCGASMLQGQRICLACGKEAVVFRATIGGKHRVVLQKVSENVESLEALRDNLSSVSIAVPKLNFISGDGRMYSKGERRNGIKLPAPLFGDLSREQSEHLVQFLAVPGVRLVVRHEHTFRNSMLSVFAAVVGVVGLLVLVGAVPALALLGAIGLFSFVAAIGLGVLGKRRWKPLLELRQGPAALPASDPLVARLAALSQANAAQDVRERLGHLALAVQRLVDHRASLSEVERRELDVVTEPAAALVDLIEAEVGRVGRLDAELAELDEGVLVRALASAEATGGDTETMLEGLHRLRDLEQSRAAAMHRLLEATTLLRRATDLGLQVRSETAGRARDVQLALATLGMSSGS